MTINTLIRHLSIVLYVFCISTISLFADTGSKQDVLISDEDSVEVFTYNILEPTISSIQPNSLKRIENLSDDSAILKEHIALSNALSLESVSPFNVETRDLTDYSIGQIPISTSISPTGGRIYNIPIPVAAGWSAVPQVAIYYNSQSGNGAVGYGWNISGISSIELRNKNYYYDGKYKHAEYDSDEAAYSLDGMPIVNSEGELDGYDYATPKGNILIKKHLTSSGIVSYFTVLYPDGSKGTFGYTSNSSYRTSYPLTKIEDVNGNSVNFSYSLWSNHYYITSITYGKDAVITFHYENRNDVGNYVYRAGTGGSYPYKRISQIVSDDGENEICQYTMTYDYKDDVSLLKEINCISDNSSYKPLTFTYGIDSEYSTEEAFGLKGQNFFLKYFTQTDDVDILYKRGKFIPGGSNDGIIMLPNFDNYDKIDSKLHWFTRYYKYGSTYSKDQTILCNLSAVEYSYQFEIKAGEGFQRIDAVDVNGDGTDELVKINNSCSVQDNTDFKIYIYSFDRYGTSYCDSLSFRVADGTHNPCFDNPAKCDYYYGNFRGTGKKMLVIATRNQSKFVLVDLSSKTKISETSLITMSDEVAGLILATDFENDGQDDLCHITDNGMDIYSLSPIYGSSFTKKRTYSGVTKSSLYYEPTYTINGLPSETPGTPYVLDINGDGYNDIAYAPNLNVEVGDITVNSPTWNVSIFNGKNFSTQYKQLYTRQKDDEIVFMDVDKDGLPDMLHFQNSRLYLIPNVNGSFQKQNTYTNISTEDNAELIPCDISAFGTHGEILTVAGPYVNVYAFNVNHSTNRLLTQFKDSFDVQYYNTYGNISQNDGTYLTDYSRSYNSSSGFMRQRIPLSVLYGSYAVAGSSTITNEYYTYYDAVFNNRGIGFCGFGKTRCIDYVHGYTTISEYDPEKMGTPIRISRTLQGSTNTPFEETINSYDNHSTTYGKLNPRLINSETINYVSGITTSTAITYDSYDYPTLTTITRSLSDGINHTEKISNTYDHNILEDKYVLGVITEKSVIKNNGSTESNLSWKEKSVITYDDCYRPLTRKDYVGDYGYISSQFRPILPLPDSLIILSDTDEQLVVDGTLQPIDTTIIRPVITRYDATNLVAETQWTYDSYGNVISEKTAPYGATSFVGNTYVYDGIGRYLVSSTNSLGQTTTFSGYNKFGKPTTATDFRGRTTLYTYDEWGNLIKTEYPDGTIEENKMDWGGQGLFTVITTASGHPTTIIHYDALGRDIRNGTQRYNSQWQYIDKVYDSKGRLQKESMPFRGTSATYWNEIAYDNYNRKTRLTEASGKVSTWTYNGTSMTSYQNGIESTRTYDANGGLISLSDVGGEIIYTLRDDGQPSEVVAPGNVTTAFSYDEYGRRKKIVDPSAGTQTDNVVYNSDGSSVATHTNPNGSIVTYTDRYGRTTRVERPGEYNTDYTYDSNGLLVSEISSNGTSKSYTYDGYDRVLSLTETVPDGKWLKKTYTYTTGSNVNTIAYESQNGVIATESFAYSNGTNIRIGLQGTHIRLINAENEFGQPTSVTTGGITRTYSYNAYGMPTRRTMGSVMDYSYTFDPLKGNLMSRTDNLRNQTETFGYDALNRLTAIDDREITYADNGNITSIDSVGDMTYDNSAKPYQVTSLTLEEDIVPSRVQNVTYTCYSRPSIMTEGGRSAAFTYNGDGARVKMNVSDGATSVLARYYIGNQYELDVTPNGTTERLYLGGDAYSAPAVYIKEGSGAWTFYNIGRDYLGNITHIATADGILVEENSYDPWGRLRNPETKEIYSLSTEPELMLGRGYTGHEHLTWFGLINMNARLYDPVLGRFLSPDPFVQMPDFTQNFNRYSYCLNNPLVYVDENGEFVFSIFLGPIGAVIDAACWGAVTGAATYTLSVAFSDGGFDNWDWNSFGSSAGWGALSGALSFGIGELYGALGNFAGDLGTNLLRGTTHGLAQGGINYLKGGDFGTGFVSGMLGSLSADFMIGQNLTAGETLLLSAVSSGFGSVMTGGNFWEGASIGLTTAGLNHLQHLSGRHNFVTRLLRHYKQGNGEDYMLSHYEFQYLMENGKIITDTITMGDDGYSTANISFYGSNFDLANSFGTATVKYKQSSNGNHYLAFKDNYNFDPKPWGERSYGAEILTRMGAMLNGVSFMIYYNKGLFL